MHVALAASHLTRADWLGLVAIVIGIAGIIAALIVAVIHSRHLVEVAKFLSTKYLGQFPDNLPHITDLVKRADKSLTILCDFPAYGALTANTKYQYYRQAIANVLLEKKAQNQDFTINFICLAPTRRREMLDYQFLPGEWNNWKQDKKNKERLENFCSTYSTALKGKSIDLITHEQFKDCFEARNDHDLTDTELFAHTMVEPSQVDLPMSIYFWICDDKEAIFTIPSFSGKGAGSFHTADSNSFYTSDSNLIRALNAIFQRYRDRSSSL